MIRKLNDKQRKRLKRKIHIRKRVVGTAERPRMTVTRSNRNLFVQVIDDSKGVTLASVSTLEKDFSSLRSNVASGTEIGKEIARRLKEKNISSVVFDRNGYLYHGVVKAVADGARENGIIF